MLSKRAKFIKEEMYWQGIKDVGIYNPATSVGKVMLDSLNSYGSRVCQINGSDGSKLTYGELHTQSIRACQHLIEFGIGKGDVIGVMARNSHLLTPLVVASFVIGAPMNPLDISFSADEVKNLFSITKPKVVLVDADVAPMVREVLDSEGLNKTSMFIMFGGERPEYGPLAETLLKPTGTEMNFIAPDIGDGRKEIGIIICSSGTMGMPKGVSLSHATVLHQLVRIPFQPSDVAMTWSTIYWITGISILCISVIRGLTRVITTDPFTPARMFSFIEKYKLTQLITNPSQMALLLDSEEIKTADLSSVRSYFGGGSIVEDDIMEKLSSYIPNGIFLRSYGLSEIGSVATIEIYNKKSGSIQLFTDNTRIKIIDEDGKPQGPNVKGQICIKVDFPFLGYYGNDEAKDTIMGEDGWIHSGDIGYFTKDAQLKIVDRIKAIIKYRNYHVSPAEVESLIYNHPMVKQVCVVGTPDPVSSDLPTAVIVTKSNVTIPAQEIIDLVADNLSQHKHLKGGVYFIDKMPLTSSGKIRRHKVREMVIDFVARKSNLNKK